MTSPTMLKALRRTHSLLQALIFTFTQYISTGKYTTRGQKFTAPSTPRTELKYGKNIAMAVADATYIVRKESLKKFVLSVDSKGRLKE